MLIESLGFVRLHRFEPTQTHGLAGAPGIEALETEQERRALTHQAQPPPQQIAHRPQGRIVNVTGRQNVEPLQIGQEECVVLVIGVFDPAVLLDLRRISQLGRIG